MIKLAIITIEQYSVGKAATCTSLGLRRSRARVEGTQRQTKFQPITSAETRGAGGGRGRGTEGRAAGAAIDGARQKKETKSHAALHGPGCRTLACNSTIRVPLTLCSSVDKASQVDPAASAKKMSIPWPVADCTERRPPPPDSSWAAPARRTERRSPRRRDPVSEAAPHAPPRRAVRNEPPFLGSSRAPG